MGFVCRGMQGLREADSLRFQGELFSSCLRSFVNLVGETILQLEHGEFQ